ncbi:MAG TPA: hypothetical protein VFA15_09770, partial [Nitrososphaera sp.]|nr:hypothetical protein [Nitrososphaera sp.]
MKTKENAALAAAAVTLSVLGIFSLAFLSKSPAAAAADFDPGLALMTSSHGIFQVGTFSTGGKIASLS